MIDLKHLIYFESLLADANNELVKQAAADGKKAVSLLHALLCTQKGAHLHIMQLIICRYFP